MYKQCIWSSASRDNKKASLKHKNYLANYWKKPVEIKDFRRDLIIINTTGNLFPMFHDIWITADHLHLNRKKMKGVKPKKINSLFEVIT